MHLGAPRVSAEPRLRRLTEYSHRAAWTDCTFERGEVRVAAPRVSGEQRPRTANHLNSLDSITAANITGVVSRRDGVVRHTFRGGLWSGAEKWQ